MNQPTILPILSTINETNSIRTIIFPLKTVITPGQFFMVWIPGVDEIPMSVSIIDSNKKGITFKVVGEATNTLFSLEKNDLIGIRGPYGNGFSYKGKSHLFVGGGTGIAMIAPAVEACMQKNNKVDVVIGAKTRQDLFFTKRLQKTNATIHIATDDGSAGYKGFASEIVSNLLQENNVDMVYTCGPEPMMKAILDICNRHNTPLQASIERYMKCAVGICGQCCIGEGLRVCVEGPIFTDIQLKQINDFGYFKRDASGKKVFFHE